MTRILRLIAMLLTAGALAGACGGGAATKTETAAGKNPAVPQAPTGESATPDPGSTSAGADACALVTEAEAEAATGSDLKIDPAASNTDSCSYTSADPSGAGGFGAVSVSLQRGQAAAMSFDDVFEMTKRTFESMSKGEVKIDDIDGVGSEALGFDFGLGYVVIAREGDGTFSVALIGSSSSDGKPKAVELARQAAGRV